MSIGDNCIFSDFNDFPEDFNHPTNSVQTEKGEEDSNHEKSQNKTLPELLQHQADATSHVVQGALHQQSALAHPHHITTGNHHTSPSSASLQVSPPPKSLMPDKREQSLPKSTLSLLAISPQLIEAKSKETHSEAKTRLSQQAPASFQVIYLKMHLSDVKRNIEVLKKLIESLKGLTTSKDDEVDALKALKSSVLRTINISISEIMEQIEEGQLKANITAIHSHLEIVESTNKDEDLDEIVQTLVLAFNTLARQLPQNIKIQKIEQEKGKEINKEKTKGGRIKRMRKATSTLNKIHSSGTSRASVVKEPSPPPSPIINKRKKSPVHRLTEGIKAATHMTPKKPHAYDKG